MSESLEQIIQSFFLKIKSAEWEWDLSTALPEKPMIGEKEFQNNKEHQKFKLDVFVAIQESFGTLAH